MIIYSQFEGPIKPNQWCQYIDPFYIISLLMSSFITATAEHLCNPKSCYKMSQYEIT